MLIFFKFLLFIIIIWYTHVSILHAIPCMSCMYHVIALIVTITMLCSVFITLAGPAAAGKYKPVYVFAQK